MPCLISEYGRNDDAHRPICSWGWYSGQGWVGGPSEAHHIRKGSNSGVGTKPSDYRTVPLCSAAHDEYHAIQHAAFCLKYDIALEWHLERINAEFAKTQRPKVDRRRAQKIDLNVRNCMGCGKTHAVPLNKAELGVKEIRFWCIGSRRYITTER